MFAHPLLVCSSDADPMASVELSRALAGTATELRVLVCVTPAFSSRASTNELSRVEGDLTAADAILVALERACGKTLRVRGDIATEAPREALRARLTNPERPDLVVFGPLGARPPDALAELAHEVALTHGVATATGTFRSGRAARVTSLLCPFDGSTTALASIGAFLRDHGSADQTLTLLALAALDPRFLVAQAAVDEVAGIRAALSTRTFEGGWLAAARGLDTIADEIGADIVTLSAVVGSGVLDVVARRAIRAIAHGERPLLFVPQVTGVPTDRSGVLDALDALVLPAMADHATVRVPVRLERVGLFGRPAPDIDEPIDVVSFGRRLETQPARGGHLQLPLGTFGLGRSAGGDPLAGIETTCSVVAPPKGRVVLLDAGLDPAEVSILWDTDTLSWVDRVILLVRTDAAEIARDSRARWLAAGFPEPRLFDVRDLIDEGAADDVPAEVANVRLARAAARLRLHGVDVALVVARAPSVAQGLGFVVTTPEGLANLRERLAAEHRPPTSADDPFSRRFDAMVGAAVVPGNDLEVQLDNADARRALVELIDGARQRLHAQWYIVEDDEVSREVEAALGRAAERGVVVRVLVDSLYSMHGSFGAASPLLTRLAAVSGVRLVASRPIDHVPTLVDLKQRDHRKIVTADGMRSIVGGRNLALNYYRSFAEASIRPSSPAKDVPWLDGSALVRGPAVRHLESSFLRAWLDAGGDEFSLLDPPQAGEITLRVVVHRGLRDAYGLEAYLALIDTARDRLLIVNSFPLQLELQHALLAAIARGVRLVMLVGHVRPSFGEPPQPFAGSSIRAVADALVRARLSALVEVGADVRELAISPMPGWDPALLAVRPYVHAKMVLADGARFAIGSANLDITAGYWESEVLLVVEDEKKTLALEAELHELIEPSPRIDPADPGWRAGASFRELVETFWPRVLS